jgi:hypothetical protein
LLGVERGFCGPEALPRMAYTTQLGVETPGLSSLAPLGTGRLDRSQYTHIQHFEKMSKTARHPKDRIGYRLLKRGDVVLCHEFKGDHVLWIDGLTGQYFAGHCHGLGPLPNCILKNRCRESSSRDSVQSGLGTVDTDQNFELAKAVSGLDGGGGSEGRLIILGDQSLNLTFWIFLQEILRDGFRFGPRSMLLQFSDHLEVRMALDHRVEAGFTPFGRSSAVLANEVDHVPAFWQEIYKILSLDLTGVGIVRADVGGELPSVRFKVVGKLRVQLDERDVCVVDKFCRGLARLLVDRNHDNEINLFGDKVLDLIQFLGNTLPRIKGNQVDAVLGGLSFHRLVERHQEWILKTEQGGAHDFFIGRRYRIDTGKDAQCRGAKRQGAEGALPGFSQGGIM